MTITVKQPTIGNIPREMDCCLARYGIVHGLMAAFPGIAYSDNVDFGQPSPFDRSIPVLLDSCLADRKMRARMAQWIRGFVAGFQCRPRAR